MIIKKLRQVGGSHLCMTLLIKTALEKQNSISIIIEPTLAQARKVYNELYKALSDTGLIEKANESLLHLRFINKSEILFKSSEQDEAIRGFTVTGILVLDEAAYIPDDFIENCLPLITKNDASLIVVSTPRFKTGWFYRQFIDKDNPKLKAYDWSTYDTSEVITPEQKELYKRMYSKMKYLTEIEGKFIDIDGAVFTGLEKIITDRPISPEGNLYMAIDFGSGNGGDNTAITILNSKKELCYIEAFNTLTPTEQVEKISRIIDEYKPFKVTAEINSIGRVYLDLLRKKHKIDEWTTTNQSKQEIIAELQKAIECQEITIPRDDDLLTELSSYDMEITKSGKITYNGNNCKDDRVMSLAICLRSLSVRKVQYRFAY